MVLIKDTAGKSFGGYFSQEMEVKTDYYGTGESFVFTFAGKNLIIYKSTMQNFFFCYSDHDGFGMGSDEHYAFYVDKCMTQGNSGHCKTFANEILSSNKFFRIKEIEVWGFNID